MEDIIPGMLTALVALSVMLCLRLNSVTNFSFLKPGPYWNIFYLDILFFSCSTALTVSYLDVHGAWAFYGVADNDFFPATIWLLFGLLAFIISFLIFELVDSHIWGRIKFISKMENVRLFLFLLIFMQLAILVAIYFYNGFLPVFGFLSGDDVNALRAEVLKGFKGPVVLVAGIKFLAEFTLIYLAISESLKGKIRYKYLIMLISLISLAWGGAKSPVVFGILLYFFSRWWAEDSKIKFKSIALLIIGSVSILFLIFYLSMGAKNFYVVLGYLAERAFLTQIAGYYQSFSLVSPDSKYILSWIPFTGYLFDNVVSFNRELMILTEGTSGTGVLKNSIFFHEAYGTFGLIGIWFAAVWVAFVVICAKRISLLIFRNMIGSVFSRAAFFICIYSASLTGGLASLAFGRFLVYPLVFLTFLFFLYSFIVFCAKRMSVWW